MKVIISGGGIAGLTLANALEKAGIDFVLLEARALLDPQVGASIAIAPSSMRIFDQFGAAQEIIDQTTPIKWGRHHRKDGSLIMPPSPSMQVLEARFGYGISFLDRQLVLRALANSIQHQDKMLLNKRVKKVWHLEQGVVVECEDGSSYDGDVVIGCDGLHSKTRQEMWRLAAESDSDHFPEKERSKMTAEYICLFGISNPIPGFDEGFVDNTYDKGHSFLIISGKGGRIFWFYFEKLDKAYHYGDDDFPRYTKEDAEKLAEKNLWRHCHERLRFQDVWEQRLSYTLVPMEEALFEKWSWGRMATCGDNTHKMTANHGQAGNNAIESAAALANHLKRLHDSGDTSSEAITSALNQWQDKRRHRIEATCKSAAQVCRDQCFDDFRGWFLLNVALPNLSEFVADRFTDTFLGAECLEYLPLPERAFAGSCPFNPRQGTGQNESKIDMLMKGLALLYFFYRAWNAGIDRSNLLEPISTPSDDDDRPKQLLAAANLLFPVGAIYCIWLFESNRRGNAFTLVQIPAAFAALALRFGLGLVAPWYYFFHFVFSPIEKFAPADNRLTNAAYTKLVVPSVLAYCSLALMLAYQGKLDKGPIWAVSIIPFHLGFAQWGAVKLKVTETDIHEDAIKNPKKDLPHIRDGVFLLCAFGTIIWWANMFYNDGASKVFNNNSDVGILIVATFTWLLMLFYDLKMAGMISGPLPLLLAKHVSGALAFGPAVSLVWAWWFREQMLADRREEHAITREKYAGKSIWEVDGMKATDDSRAKD